MTKDMTTGSSLRHIIALATPLCIGMFFQQFYNMVDAMIVGKVLGVNQLAGVGATSSLYFIIVWFCTGMCNGFAIPIAQSFGAKQETELRRFVGNSVWLCVIFGAAVTSLSAIFCRQMLVVLRTPTEIIDYAHSYILVIFLGIPCIMLYSMLEGISRALGDSKTPLMFLMVSSVINIGLDVLFVVQFRMGVVGAAVATITSQGMSGFACLIFMKKKFSILKLSRDEWRFRSYHAAKLCKIAVPMGLQYSVTGIGSVVLQFAVNGLGSLAVAGVTTAMKLNNIIKCPIEALGSAMAPFTGQNIGAGKVERVTEGVKKASMCGWIWSIICLPILYFSGRPLAALFMDEFNQTVVDYAFKMLMITACGYALLTLVNVVRFSIQGMGHSSLAIVSGAMEMVARILAGVVLIPIFGFTGACFAHVLAWVFADVFLIPAFLFCRKRARAVA